MNISNDEFDKQLAKISSTKEKEQYRRWYLTVSDYMDFETFKESLLLQATSKIKNDIINHACNKKKKKQAPKQLSLFSFLPTNLTRVSPFFPMSRKEMKNRPTETLTFENSWGEIKFHGEKLSIYDESILLALLVLTKKNNNRSFDTTRYEICGIIKVASPSKSTYTAIWDSIDRLSKTHIDIAVKKEEKTTTAMTGSIISWAKMDEETDGISLEMNPYFLEMYIESFVTGLDLTFRNKIKSDVAKAMYRFLKGQKQNPYPIGLLKFAKAINLDTEQDLYRIRDLVKKGLTILTSDENQFLKNWNLDANDNLLIWKNTNKTELPSPD